MKMLTKGQKAGIVLIIGGLLVGIGIDLSTCTLICTGIALLVLAFAICMGD